MYVDLSAIKSDPFFILFKKNLKDKFNIKKKDKILLCVSGGMDSMALLFLFLPIKHYRIQIAHVNYKIRKESDSDMNFVKLVSGKFNIPYFSSSFLPESMKRGENFEAWARKKRYKYFEEISNENSIDWIATGHHKNDNVETLFFNLSRQTGLSGLKGISEKREKVFRPLLRFSKFKINEFCTRNSIPYINDESNNNQKYYRNFIRHSVLKNWEQYDPNIISSLNASINHFVEWNNAIDSLIKKIFIVIIKTKESRIEIPYTLIKGIPINIVIRIFQLAINEKNILWKKHELFEIKKFINSNKIGKKIKIKEKWIFVHDRSFIIGEKLCSSSKIKSKNIKVEEEVIFNEYIYKLSLKNKEGLFFDKNNNFEYINWDLIKDKKLVLRQWREGDFFYPLGMNSRQKISDFLINNKIDYFSKLKQTVMTADGKIFWVCGKRISNWVRINDDTREVASLEKIKKNNYDQSSKRTTCSSF